MRYYSNYEHLQLWRGAPDLSSRVTAGSLTAVRVQPVLRQSLPKSIVDFVFTSERGVVAVPAVLLDSPQVVAREKDPLIWPEAIARAVQADSLDEIQERVMPWIRSLTMGRGLNHELVRHFGNDAERALFEEARAAGAAGAAMVQDVVTTLSPYVYASRYALGKRIVVGPSRGAAQGAAFLSQFGAVAAELGGEEHWAQKWFGVLPKAHSAEGSQLVIGPIADAPQDAVRIVFEELPEPDAIACVVPQVYPMDILFTYETLHGPPARRFSIRTPVRPLPRRGTRVESHAAAGGSNGRVLIGLREDWSQNPDADTDSALALAQLLRAEGLSVDVSGEAATCDMASYGVVHCFNLIEAPSALQFLMRAKAAGKRTILTATFQDAADERTWGALTAPTCIREAIDEPSVERYIGFLERRALLAPGWEERSRRGPFPDFDAMVLQALSYTDVVIAESEAEGAVLRDRFARRADLIVVPPFGPSEPLEAIRPPVDLTDFVLVHAPIEPRSNQLYAMRAAKLADVPLILAGPVRDMEYAARVREAADARVFILESPGAAQLEWLYAAAGVVLDPSWYAYGTARLHRALLSGARLAASQTGWAADLWPGAVATADPASPKDLARAIKNAPFAPPSVVQKTAGEMAATTLLRNIVGAYLDAPEPAVSP